MTFFTNPRIRRLGATAISAGLLLAACGNSSPGASSSASANDAGADLGFGLRELGLTDAEWTTTVESVQTGIAQCMAEAGFEYIPADVDTVELAMSAVRTEPGVDRRAYKEQWGYGVTTRFDNRPKEIELGEQNLAIYDSLSDTDQVAYDRTLYGNDEDATFAFMFDEEDFESAGGCTRAAIDTSFTSEQLDPNFVNPKDVFLENDGRFAAADLLWTDCMGDAGYDYEDQDEIIEEYQDLLDELVSDEDAEALTGTRAEALADLQADEIAVSLVDLECQGPVDEVVRDLEIELFGRVVSVG